MSVFNVQPTVLTDSTRQFVIPPTILSDYHNYLHTEVPNVVFDFELLQDWYEQFEEGYEPTYLRAEHFPINWKSKIGNSDANKNFYTDFDVPIHKGDIAVREDGLIVMMNWSIQEYINAQTTQAIECNHRITITRHVDAEADKRGMKIADAHDEVIVDDMPCVLGEYAGRPDFASAQNTPGIHADMLNTLSLQWNDKTKNVRIGDNFYWYEYRYRIVNLSYAEVDIRSEHGILTANAKRVAGDDLEV